MKMGKLLSVITVNYNGIAHTRKMLGSLEPIMKDGWEAIVVDNASSADEAGQLSESFPWAKCVRSGENLGFSGGNNLGADNAEGEYLFFVNNDVIFTSDCISPLLERIRGDRSIAAVSPRIRNLDGSYNYAGCDEPDRFLMRIHYRTKLFPAQQVSSETPLVHGAAVMVSSAALRAVGGWQEMYFLYSEEIDLSLQLRRRGYKLWYEPGAELLHVGSAAVGKKSALNCYYNSRNRLLLYRRNLRGWRKPYAIAYHLCITSLHNSLQFLARGERGLLKAYWEGIADFLCGRFGKKPAV